MNTSDRINLRMKELGLAPADIMAKTGVSRGAVSQWRNGITEPGGDRLLSLAAALQVSPQWLLSGKGSIESSPNITPAPLGHCLIPIINDVQAGMWKEIQADFHTSEMLLTDLDLSPSAFALTIKGDSMLPDFREGDRVIIDPEVHPVPGDFVAAVNGSNAATFKKYRERGVNADGVTVFELVPLNNDYPTLRSDIEHISIVGTMMEHRKYRKR